MNTKEKIEDYIESISNIKNSLPAFGFIIFPDVAGRNYFFAHQNHDSAVDLVNEDNPYAQCEKLIQTLGSKEVLFLNIDNKISPMVYDLLSNIFNDQANTEILGMAGSITLGNLNNKKLIFAITEADLDNPIYESFNTSVCRLGR